MSKPEKTVPEGDGVQGMFPVMDSPKSAQDLIARARFIDSKGTFLGGVFKNFENEGRSQLVTAIRCGLMPESKVLDVGCGCLRGGYWMINFLRPGRYFGIEPYVDMLEAGKNVVLGSKIVEEKQPRFDTNEDFNFSVFGEKFDYVIAQSIWTHASQDMIRTMLDEFIRNSHKESIFLATYKRAKSSSELNKNKEWIGQSHQSRVPGRVYYTFRFMQKLCRERGLHVRELGWKNCAKQRWLAISADKKRLEQFMMEEPKQEKRRFRLPFLSWGRGG